MIYYIYIYTPDVRTYIYCLYAKEIRNSENIAKSLGWKLVAHNDRLKDPFEKRVRREPPNNPWEIGNQTQEKVDCWLAMSVYCEELHEKHLKYGPPWEWY